MDHFNASLPRPQRSGASEPMSHLAPSCSRISSMNVRGTAWTWPWPSRTEGKRQQHVREFMSPAPERLGLLWSLVLTPFKRCPDIAPVPLFHTGPVTSPVWLQKWLYPWEQWSWIWAEPLVSKEPPRNVVCKGRKGHSEVGREWTDKPAGSRGPGPRGGQALGPCWLRPASFTADDRTWRALSSSQFIT